MNAVCNHRHELLIILVSNLENAAMVICADFNQSRRNRRIKTDLNACRIRCKVIKVQCNEVSCALRCSRFTAADVFQRTANRSTIHSHIVRLQCADRNAVNGISLRKRFNREAYEGFTVTLQVAV